MYVNPDLPIWQGHLTLLLKIDILAQARFFKSLIEFFFFFKSNNSV